MATTGALGGRREKQAQRFLKRHGLQIVDTNYRSRLGEIDIVAVHDDCLVFVEVRYRADDRFGRAAVTVDGHKQRKLMLAAQGFLARHPQFATSTCRFDVIGMDGNKLSWIKDAFRPQ